MDVLLLKDKFWNVFTEPLHSNGHTRHNTLFISTSILPISASLSMLIPSRISSEKKVKATWMHIHSDEVEGLIC
jgi:hypothetical protein